MELQEVKQYLKDNAEKGDVKAYLAELSKISAEKQEEIIKEYKISQDFKSEIDKAVTKGITTFKEKTMPGIIEEKINENTLELEKKYNPPKNPAEEAIRKELENVQKELSDTRNKTIKEGIENIKLSIFSEMKLPAHLANNFFLKMDNLTVQDLEDKEKIRSLILPQIEPWAKYIEDSKNETVAKVQANSAYKPTDSSNSHSAQQLTKEALDNMTPAEINAARESGQLNQILKRN